MTTLLACTYVVFTRHTECIQSAVIYNYFRIENQSGLTLNGKITPQKHF